MDLEPPQAEASAAPMPTVNITEMALPQISTVAAEDKVEQDLKLRVALRVRPLLPHELQRGCQEVVSAASATQVKIEARSGENKGFTYDFAFGKDSKQDEVYNSVVLPLVDGCFDGYNATVLAYGQTGSGKTHTVGSSTANQGDDGIIPRVMEEMFRRISSAEEGAKPVVRCSFMELYKEELKDLLDVNTDKVIRMYDTDKGPTVQGCTERTVENLEEMQRCLEEGSQGRVTAATKMNEQSSRSHAIFTIHIEQQVEDDVTTAKFHFVDLAGSERASKTEAVGEQLQEGIKINQSLFALGNVISALGDDTKKGEHVPYRDSKLTRLLQDSLGGNSRTVMIACVSPADFNAGESETTLRYANRARNITNKPVKNIDPNKAQILELKHQLMMLCKEMQDMKEAGGHSAQQEQTIANLRIELDAALQTAKNASGRQLQAEMERDRIKSLLEQHGLQGAGTGEDSVSAEEMSVIEHHVRTIQEQDAKILELELRINAGSVQGLEFDADEGEEEIVKEEAAHNCRVSSMEAEMKSLMENLASKEADIDAANSNITEEQFKALETEYSKLQSEHKDLLQQMEKGSFEENKALQRKVAVLEKQMKDAKKKQDDYKRLKHLQARGELRVKEVENEMDTLKKKKVALARKMSDESKKFSEWKTARSREVAALKRDAQRQTYELSKMAGQKAKTESVLKRKMEEIAAANRRMKGMSDQLAAAKKHRLNSNSTRQGVGLARHSSKDLTMAQKKEAAEERRKWLEEELSLCSKVRSAKRAFEKETEERKLKQDEIAMMQANLTRLQGRGASEESTAKIQARIGDVSLELESKEALLAELQKQLVGTEDIQSQNKRWEFVKQMDEAKNYIKSSFMLALNLMDERDAMAERLAECEENARVSHAQVVQRLYEERSLAKKEAMEKEEAQKWQIAAALTKNVEGSEVAAMLEEAMGTIKGLRVGINEASNQKDELERENKRLKAAIQNSGDVVRSPAEEGPAVAKQSAPTVSDVDMDMLHLGRKYDELEKEHLALKEELQGVKKENHHMRQMAKKRRQSNEGKKDNKPTWNSGISTQKTKEELAEIEKMKREKQNLPRKPALPKEALAPKAPDTARTEGGAKEDEKYEETESEFESESEFDYDTDDSDFEMGSSKTRKHKPKATPRSEVQPSTVKAPKPVLEPKPVALDETGEKRYNKTALNKMKVAEVRDLCQQYGLDTKGKKDFLMQRVLEYYAAKDNDDQDELTRLAREANGEVAESTAAAPVVEASVAEAISKAESHDELDDNVEWGETVQQCDEEFEEATAVEEAAVADIMDVTELTQQAVAPAEQTVNTTAGGAVLCSNIRNENLSSSAKKKRSDMRELQMAKYRKDQENGTPCQPKATPSGKRKLHTSRVLSEMDPNESPVGTPTKVARTPGKNSPMPVSMREPPSEQKLTEALKNASLLSEPRFT